MEAAVYAVEAEVEATHWWFVGRRRLFAREIAAAGVPSDARVLDIGTGTGANLRLLRDLGFRRVSGLDLSEIAIRFCEAKGLGPVRQGSISAIPYPDASFDLILATDIIEHVDDDAAALREIARVLAPGGRALITVPTFAALWGLQDEVAQHRRRYRAGPLLALARRAGLVPERHYYFNYLLFVPIWLARQLIRLAGIRLKSEGQLNSPMLNRVLSAVFAADVRTAPRVAPPFGVSMLLLAAKGRADG